MSKVNVFEHYQESLIHEAVENQNFNILEV